MELNKFCTPNRRDDLSLFFGLHTSSLRVILELSVHYNFLQRVTSVTRHSNFSFGKFSLFSLSSCKFVGCPQKKKESRTLFFPVPIRIPDWFRTFRSEYFHWMATWQSEQCLDFAGFILFLTSSSDSRLLCYPGVAGGLAASGSEDCCCELLTIFSIIPSN